MKKFFYTITIAGVLLFACKSSNAGDPAKTLSLNFEAKSGSKVSGTAVFVEKNGKVTLTAKLSGLKPGVHAIHIHEKSDCSAADATSTGGHWNPTFKKHGKWGDAEYHKGDIGNFTTDVDGNGTVLFTTDEWCIGCGDETKDILGKGLIVHDKPDDFVTQPTGNAGARVACSAIIK
ncbi:superoxide dismutase family protein [Flavobacterium sedimenticola]|uniref:Superoxide dismutase [Cu-Zn] n=1 Tax=Flavobacterium sedimenticola TaxID=3043286 RepID=A0ABT6XSR6_9FLAO|nr:superoxide dismutase family protein [Flavobacterium sedimenticola]MDI9258146.1 superoxide dismutase family protein [Flavobacterium sedimenticola]